MIAENVVCVLVSYWPQRAANIAEICRDVLEMEVSPRKIIVINNNPSWKLRDLNDEIFSDPRVALLDSDTNFTSRSKYAVAMLEPSPYYLLLDDDISVLPGMLKRFLEFAKPGCAFSNWGVLFEDNMLSSGLQVKSVEMAQNAEPQAVDAFIGIVQFVSFEAIIKMFQVEAQIRLPNLPLFRSVGEDILIAQAQGPGGAHVVPIGWHEGPKFVERGDEAMQDDWGYYQFRDRFSYMAREFTGHLQDLDKFIPGTQDYDIKAIHEYIETVKKRDQKYTK
jgi:hypothetical protein